MAALVMITSGHEESKPSVLLGKNPRTLSPETEALKLKLVTPNPWLQAL